MGCVASIRKALSGIAPEENWVFDLDSPDKTMTYTGEGEIDSAAVEKAVRAIGHKCERL